MATSCGSSGRTISAHEVFAHIGGHPLGHGLRPQGQSPRLHRRHGPLSVTPEQEGHEAHRRDQPQLALGRRRFPAAARRRSRHRPGRPRSISARRPSATSRRNGRSTRWRAAATAASSATTRGRGTTRTKIHKLVFAERHLHGAGRLLLLLRRELDLPRQPLLVRRPEEGQDRDRHRQPSGLSGQHQPRLGRQLLAGAARHAHAGARSRARHAGLSPPHGATRRARPLALSQHQYRLRHQIRRERARSSRACGISAARTTR